jgi:cytoskeleton protein RodZ
VSDVGDRLKRAREARGLTLQDIARTTKISVVVLEALERLDYARVPGGVFGRSFVRGYALAVGVDADAAVAEFQAAREHHERRRAAEKAQPEISDDDREFLARQHQAIKWLRAGAVVAAFLAVSFAIYEVSVWWPRAAQPGGASAGAPARPGTATPGPAPPKGEEAPPSPAVTPPSLGAVAPIVVEFTAIADCWLQLSADGTLVLSRELKAGERYRAEAARELDIHAGSAGALDWTINGKPAKALGPAGKSGRATVTPQNVASFLRKGLLP